MSRLYMWDRAADDWVEIDRTAPPPPRLQIMSEIQPYRSPMGDGLMIETRRQRDEHLRTHGCVIADPVHNGALVNPKNAGHPGYDCERSKDYYRGRAENAGDRRADHINPHDGGR